MNPLPILQITKINAKMEKPVSYAINRKKFRAPKVTTKDNELTDDDFKNIPMSAW